MPPNTFEEQRDSDALELESSAVEVDVLRAVAVEQPPRLVVAVAPGQRAVQSPGGPATHSRLSQRGLRVQLHTRNAKTKRSQSRKQDQAAHASLKMIRSPALVGGLWTGQRSSPSKPALDSRTTVGIG